LLEEINTIANKPAPAPAPAPAIQTMNPVSIKPTPEVQRVDEPQAQAETPNPLALTHSETPLILLQPQPQPQPQPQNNFSFYPDAGKLKKKMDEAAQFGFDQWGFNDTQAQQNQLQNTGQSRFDYGPEMFSDMGNYNQYFDNPYPVQLQPENNNAFYSSYTNNNAKQYPQALPDTSYPVPDYYSYGVNSLEPMMPQSQNIGGTYTPDNYGQASHSPYLMPSDNYPVPENIYGMSNKSQPRNHSARPNTSDYQNNLQYFRKIPEEEIIYPPNYPGRR